MSDLPIPAAALAQHIIALGKTRSGKSSKLRVVVEHLLEHAKPVCIIDPKGDWWGLKSSANGKTAGYPLVVFGGEHADVPINEHSGSHIAELVATGNRPCLIDLGGWTVGARTRFFIDFASTLFKLTKGTRYLAIDEVHNFCPKGRVFDADAGKMLHWANRLASEGQGKGLVLLAASQRPQKVHNDFLTSCETLIACRVIHKADRDAIKDWIDGCADAATGRDVLATLAQMDRTDAWVWSPEIDFGPKQIKFPMFRTYDSFRPQDPGAGELKGWATVDLEDVKAKLAAVVKDAEANDPKKLKARIAELERQVKQADGQVMSLTSMSDREQRLEIENEQQAERIAILERDNRALEQHRDAVAAYASRLRKWIATLERRIEGIRKHLASVSAAVAETDLIASEDFDLLPDQPPFPTITKTSAPAPAARTIRHETSPPVRPAASSAPRPSKANGSGGPSVRRVLIALAENPAGLTRRKLGLLADVNPNLSTWRAVMAELRRDALIEETDDLIRITDAGYREVGDYEPLPTGEALIEYWRGRIGNPARVAIFDAVVAARGRPVPAVDVAAAAGVDMGKSTWRAHMAELRGLDLVRGTKELRASEELFG